jgi:hypothetical protein
VVSSVTGDHFLLEPAPSVDDPLVQPESERVGRQGLVSDNDGVVPRGITRLDALDRPAAAGVDGGRELVRGLLEARLNGCAEFGLPADLSHVEKETARLRLHQRD